MLDNPTYEPILKEMGLLSVELMPENQLMIDLYDKIVDPTNFKIYWQDYFLFCYLEDYPDWKDNQEVILHIRNTVNNYNEKKFEKQRESINNKHNYNDEPMERIKRIE